MSFERDLEVFEPYLEKFDLNDEEREIWADLKKLATEREALVQELLRILTEYDAISPKTMAAEADFDQAIHDALRALKAWEP